MTSARAKAAKLARDKVYQRMVMYLMARHRNIKEMSAADAARLEEWIKPAVGRYLDFMQEHGYRDGKK